MGIDGSEGKTDPDMLPPVSVLSNACPKGWSSQQFGQKQRGSDRGGRERGLVGVFGTDTDPIVGFKGLRMSSRLSCYIVSGLH